MPHLRIGTATASLALLLSTSGHGEARLADPGGPSPSSPSPSGSPAPENGAEPAPSSDELAERARGLFDAIVTDEPEHAAPFFFPREPFLRLKDVADPGRYHAELVRVYRRDIHRLHARRRTWEGATFVGFELGSRPRWVKPGEEWNKIGYHRTFDGKLAYELAGKSRSLSVRTIISWEGRWYVTHLLPMERERRQR